MVAKGVVLNRLVRLTPSQKNKRATTSLAEATVAVGESSVILMAPPLHRY